MIFDKIANIGRYKGINKNLDTAIDYIRNNDLSSLPMGRTELDGEVYINVMEANAAPLETKCYEIHKNIWTSKLICPARKSSIPGIAAIWLLIALMKQPISALQAAIRLLPAR